VPSDLDELVKFLDQSSIQTSQGSFVSAENIRKWVEERKKEAIETADTRPRPKTMVQAKRMAARDEELFPKKTTPPREGGSSIAAGPLATNVTGT
jgi:hypothetical protein